MRILLPRDLHIGNVDFDKLSPDDVVTVQVLRSRFQTNDPFISSVGLFISRSAQVGLKVSEDSEAAEEG